MWVNKWYARDLFISITVNGVHGVPYDNLPEDFARYCFITVAWVISDKQLIPGSLRCGSYCVMGLESASQPVNHPGCSCLRGRLSRTPRFPSPRFVTPELRFSKPWTAVDRLPLTTDRLQNWYPCWQYGHGQQRCSPSRGNHPLLTCWNLTVGTDHKSATTAASTAASQKTARRQPGDSQGTAREKPGERSTCTEKGNASWCMTLHAFCLSACVLCNMYLVFSSHKEIIKKKRKIINSFIFVVF